MFIRDIEEEQFKCEHMAESALVLSKDCVDLSGYWARAVNSFLASIRIGRFAEVGGLLSPDF